VKFFLKDLLKSLLTLQTDNYRSNQHKKSP